jgi:hypothetical protein
VVAHDESPHPFLHVCNFENKRFMPKILPMGNGDEWDWEDMLTQHEGRQGAFVVPLPMMDASRQERGCLLVFL